MALATGPIRAPAIGSTQNVEFGKAAHPSSSARPVLRVPRISWDAISSTPPTPARTMGATIWWGAVRRHAENSPSSAAVATSCARRYTGQPFRSLGPPRWTARPVSAPMA
jgi:hypothetical protein